MRLLKSVHRFASLICWCIRCGEPATMEAKGREGLFNQQLVCLFCFFFMNSFSFRLHRLKHICM